MSARIRSNWDWRVSGHMRAWSLAATWLLLFLPVGPAWLVAALAIVRFAATPIQLWLNRWLVRQQPIAPRDRYDWGLLAVLLVGVLAVSVAERLGGPHHSGLLLLIPLLPYSGIQVRQCRRSYSAYAMHRPAFAWDRVA